jgi:thiosulfate dehydrogenase
VRAGPLAALFLASLAVAPTHDASTHGTSTRVGADTVDISIVPPDSAIPPPSDSLGAALRRGRAILQHTPDSLPQYALSNLRCMSCHLDDGRRPGVAPLVGTFARYPRYVARAGAVADMQARINFCLTRSLAGHPLPSSSRQMQDMLAYLAWLSTNIPVGAPVHGQGLPAMPRLAGDSTHGATLYAEQCARCHGATGDGTPIAPAVWGPRSFNIGASMARQERAASFIRHAMPYDRPGTLSDQDAFDVAAFMLSHPRPDLATKSHDWPAGDAPYDVPYSTASHAAFHPPPLIPARN